MKTTLPTLSEIVDKQKESEISVDDCLLCIWFFNDFLKLKLQLWMFIPCKDGVPLEENPSDNDYYWDDLMPIAKENGFSSGSEDAQQELEQETDRLFKIEYQQALDRVIFKGFELVTSHNKYVRLQQNSTLTNLSFGEKVIRLNGQVIKLISDLTNKVKLTDKEFKRLGL